MAPPKKSLSTEDAPELTLKDIECEEITSSVFIIIPEIAEKLIEEGTNPLNRPVSDSTVDEYLAQMKKGRWKLNGEAVIFSKDKPPLLLDGQHRLWACYKGKKAFRTLVTCGVDKETFATIDTGKKRSGSDALIIHSKLTGLGTRYTTQLAAAATMCIQLQTGNIKNKGGHGRGNVTRQDIIDFVEKNPELITWIERSRSKKSWATSYTAGIASVCYLASKNGFEMKAMAFMHGFITGENLDGRSSIMALRNRLGVDKHLLKAERMAYMIHALNKFIANEPLTILKLPKGYEFPEIRESEKKLAKKGGKKDAVQPKLEAKE